VSDEKDILLHRATEEVVAAVQEWMTERPWQHRELTRAEQRLQSAFYQRERTKKVTGKIKVATPTRGTKLTPPAGTTPPGGIAAPKLAQPGGTKKSDE